MIDWTDQQQQIRSMFRQFVENEIAPRREELEFGDTPPYDVLRKMYQTFGIGQMALGEFEKQIAREEAGEAPGRRDDGKRKKKGEPDPAAGEALAMRMIPVIEISRYCPGMVTALGVSVGLTANAIMRRGTLAQKREFVPPLLTLEKIGAWAITEPSSGSDAFGSMRATARRDGDEFVLNGNKTFITNGPYADTIIFICKLDEDNAPAERKIVSFILDRGTPGLEQSPPLRKMGQHSSPTGELFLDDVRVPISRLVGETTDVEARSAAKQTFASERVGVAAMALGIVEKCLELCTEYAKTRVQFGRPIGEFQLIQQKLAKMEVARMNIQNLIFRQIGLASAGRSMDLAEASACKLYCAQATMEATLEAVQLYGGNGYMAEYQVEQLCRDAKVLQIYGGTDEIQTSQIARSLLRR